MPLVLAAVLAAAGCDGQSSSNASATHPATGAPTVARPQAASPASPAAHASPSVSDVYLAEGQDINATTAQRPRCTDGCPLSGDGTVVVYDMSWPEWTSSRAIGTGTETIQSCLPNCAAGPQYRVRTVLTFTQPVKDCVTGHRFWTQAAFRFPHGLDGAPAPVNPWTFTGVAAEARATCHR
jgi:hypothetical protein